MVFIYLHSIFYDKLIDDQNEEKMCFTSNYEFIFDCFVYSDDTVYSMSRICRVAAMEICHTNGMIIYHLLNDHIIH